MPDDIDPGELEKWQRRFASRSNSRAWAGPEAQPWEVAIAHAVAANVAAANSESERHAEHYATATRLIAALPSAEERKILEATLKVVPKPATPGGAA